MRFFEFFLPFQYFRFLSGYSVCFTLPPWRDDLVWSVRSFNSFNGFCEEKRERMGWDVRINNTTLERRGMMRVCSSDYVLGLIVLRTISHGHRFVLLLLFNH